MADERQASGASWERMVEHIGGGTSLSDASVVGKLMIGFIHGSFGQDHVALLKSAKDLTDIFAGKNADYLAQPGWNPEGLAASLQALLPQATEHTDDPEEIIMETLALGALVARDLLKQAGDNKDRAFAYLNLFQQDWTRLFMGIPMQHRWVEPPAGQASLFEGLP